jgi:hypothetical protein
METSAILSAIELLTFLYGVVLAEVLLSDETAIHEMLDALKPAEGVNNLGPSPKPHLYSGILFFRLLLSFYLHRRTDSEW